MFQFKSIFIPSCVGPVYKDMTYNCFYMLSLPISSLCAVGQTIDELLQAVKLNWTPSTGEGLLLQHRMTRPRTSSICHISELNHHKAQFQNTISNLFQVQVWGLVICRVYIAITEQVVALYWFMEFAIVENNRFLSTTTELISVWTENNKQKQVLYKVHQRKIH